MTSKRAPCLPLLSLVLATALGLSTPAACACDGSPLNVAVDIGHSKAAYGVLSATGVPEYEFNKRFAEELVDAAKAIPSLNLFLIEPTGKTLELQDRPKLAAAMHAHIFLSIHHDGVNDKYIKHWDVGGRSLEYSDDFHGYSVFIGPKGKDTPLSEKLAKSIGKNLAAAGFTPALHHAEPIRGENRRLLDRELGVYEAPFVVLRLATTPAVLFEVGVIVNRDEEKKLQDTAHRAKIEEQLLNALRDYCNP